MAAGGTGSYKELFMFCKVTFRFWQFCSIYLLFPMCLSSVLTLVNPLMQCGTPLFSLGIFCETHIDSPKSLFCPDTVMHLLT